jgi:ribosomal protein S18 acetylase RimI-like enzyme
MAEIIEGNATHIPVIIEIAETTWAATYRDILAPETMRYMLDTIYAADTLLRVMRDGSQRFILIKEKNGYPGFASYGSRHDETGVFKLHKIYVLPNNQGKGYGKLLIDSVKQQLVSQNATALDLNVNRYNPAQDFYKKLGFKIIREEDVPIGNIL